MRLTFLGTGTSCGVPTIGCQCYTCTSKDPHDKRLRCSALVETETTRILIDCGPDFRQQMMPQPFRNVYADPIAREGLLQMLPYCFAEHRYPGVPAIQLHEIHKHEPLRIGDLDIMPIEVMHHDLPILGFRISPLSSDLLPQPSLAYITDMKTIDGGELDYLRDVDTLIVNALRQKPHHSHQTLSEAVDFAKVIGACQTWLIHSSHDIGRHEEVNASLPSDIQMAYDGQVIEIG